MSGVEVIAVLGVVGALISAFNDSTELGKKARAWWRRHRLQGNNSSQIETEVELDQSLVQNPRQIRQRFDDNVLRFGDAFKEGDDIGRMDLMQCLLNMYRDMLKTTQLMLEQKIEYDPRRLLLASNQTRDSTLDSFNSLAQRLAVQSHIPSAISPQPETGWRTHASATSSRYLPQRINRVHTIHDSGNDPRVISEQQRLETFARAYIESHPSASPSQTPSHSSSDLTHEEFNAFCPGRVEEIYYSGSQSVWECRKCGSSISFDYTRIDRNQDLAELLFACHLPIRSGTARYKCILCRAKGLPPHALEVFYDKMDIVAHYGTHDAAEFKDAGFDEWILYDSIPE